MEPDRHLPGSLERMLVLRERVRAIEAGEMEPAQYWFNDSDGRLASVPTMFHPGDLTLDQLSMADGTLSDGPEGEVQALPSTMLLLEELKKHMPLPDELNTGKSRIGK